MRLITNALHRKPTKRLSAKGIVEYLSEKCELAEFSSLKDAREIFIFNKIKIKNLEELFSDDQEEPELVALLQQVINTQQQLLQKQTKSGYSTTCRRSQRKVVHVNAAYRRNEFELSGLLGVFWGFRISMKEVSDQLGEEAVVAVDEEETEEEVAAMEAVVAEVVEEEGAIAAMAVVVVEAVVVAAAAVMFGAMVAVGHRLAKLTNSSRTLRATSSMVAYGGRAECPLI
uniref:Uncharacterized protein n=1 Tax=Globodera pallida TaxID=36090 RepID=A0A183BZS9_GLOPA